MAYTTTNKLTYAPVRTFEEAKAKVDSIMATHQTLEVDGFSPRLADVESYSDFGLESMGRMVDFPANWIRRLNEYNPMLAKNNISTQIQHHFEEGDQNFFVREFNGKICGAVSNRYAFFDDDQVMDIIDGSELTGMQYRHCIITPERLHLRAIDMDNTFKIPGDDSDLCFAYFIDNSMVGLSSFKVQLGIFRLLCTNGLIAPVRECVICKMVHRGTKDIAAEFNESIKLLNGKKEAFLESIKEMTSKESVLERMEEEMKLDYLSKKLNLSQKGSKAVYDLYRDVYGGQTKWALTNAITQYARDVNSIEMRTSLERRALIVA